MDAGIFNKSKFLDPILNDGCYKAWSDSHWSNPSRGLAHLSSFQTSHESMVQYTTHWKVVFFVAGSAIQWLRDGLRMIEISLPAILKN